MKCPTCGNDNPKDGQFCTGCGASLSVSTASSTEVESAELPMTEDRRQLGPDEHFCSSCGEIIKKLAEICPKCGVRIKEPPAATSEKKKSSKFKIGWKTIIGAIAVIVIIGVVASSGGQDSSGAVKTSSGSNLGERLGHHNNNLFYLPSVTKQEAQKLLDYLVKQEFFDSETETDAQLRKDGGVYELRMSLKEGIDPNDTDVKEMLSLLTCSLEVEVFSNSTVHWLAVGDSFDDIKKRYMCP